MEPWSVVRWARAAGFSATCAALASAAHVAGGGQVHRSSVVVAAGVLLVPAWALTGRERTLRTIMPVLGAVQILLHLVFGEISPHRAMEPVPVMRMPEGQHGTGSSAGFSMFLMHLVAVIVTAWWLRRGEAGLCSLARLVTGWVLAPLCLLFAALVPVRAVAAPVWPDAPRPRGTVLRHALVTRGPPAGAVAPG
ncbi:hypothetical protein [Actinocorallia longicatena]|uniref:MFS transporter n=1 Tax=Actinocorallia longicatena TaxID=111803 RepID=A0ABP6QCT7_9ACTN